MPFENFYKSADQHARRWRMCVLAAIFLLAAYSGGSFLLARIFTPPSPPPAAAKVREADRRAADALCRDLPQPEQLSLASIEEKKAADGAARVIYTYTTGRGVDEIMPPFLIWFETEGWTRDFERVYAGEEVTDRRYIFRTRNRQVSISYFDRQENVHATGPARYEITCTIEKTKP